MAELKTMPPRDSFTPAIATPLRPHLATGQWEGGSSLGWSALLESAVASGEDDCVCAVSCAMLGLGPRYAGLHCCECSELRAIWPQG